MENNHFGIGWRIEICRFNDMRVNVLYLTVR